MVTIKDQSENLQFRLLGWCSGDKNKAKTLSLNLPPTPADLQICFIVKKKSLNMSIIIKNDEIRWLKNVIKKQF